MQICAGHQLALVEAALRINLGLVGMERRNFLCGEEFVLGNPDAMLAGNHPAQPACQHHDACHGSIRFAQHLVMVGVDWQVGVYIAVAGVHVQGHEHAAAQHFLVDCINAFEHRAIHISLEDFFEFGAQLGFPGDAYGIILHAMEEPQNLGTVAQRAGRDAQRVELSFGLVQGHVQIAKNPLPALAYRADQFPRLLAAVPHEFGAVECGFIRTHRQLALQIGVQRIAQAQLAGDREFNVDAFDAVTVIPHARQRDDNVFIDLERVGVAGNRGRARAVEPEFLARFGGDRNEAFGATGVAPAHDFRGSAGHIVLIVTHDVAEQHHLRAALALGFGGVTHGFHIALVEVLQACEQHTPVPGVGQRGEKVLDLDDGRHRFADL